MKLKFELKRLLIVGLILLFNFESFAQSVFNIKDFGAKGDSLTINTTAIQAAIDAAFEKGGGTVLFPAGTYLSSSIRMKSNVTLHLEKEAILLGSPQRTGYQKAHFYALIVAEGQTNIGIKGNGVIDGNGKLLAMDTERLASDGVLPDAREANRPAVINWLRCKNATVRDITIRNSAMWVQDYRECVNLLIENITVRSNVWRNNDGIDITDCKHVVVRGCDIDSEDDGICPKSSSSFGCEDMLIENCRVRSSCNGLKFGTASVGGFKNITVRNLEIYDTYQSAIAIECVDGGVIENIKISNIKITGSNNPLFIRLGNRNSPGAPGTVSGITISDVTAEIPTRLAGTKSEHLDHFNHYRQGPLTALIVGLPGYHIRGVKLHNISITYGGIGDSPEQKEDAPKFMRKQVLLKDLTQVSQQKTNYPEAFNFGIVPAWGLYIRYAEDIELDNVTVKLKEGGSDYRAALLCDSVKNISLNRFNILHAGKEPVIVLHNVNGAKISNSVAPAGAVKFIETMGNTSGLSDLGREQAIETNNVTHTATNAQDTNQGTYFVKPSGDDSNSGNKTSPFKTINKAASIAQPGDTIIIYGGLYRERVNPINGGTGENSRIMYKAAKGEVPVIKGSEEINEWTDQGNGIWMVQLQESFFQGYNPYRLTIEGDWLNTGKWNHRGDVYLNGLLFQEKQTLAELQRENSWYTDSDSILTRIYANFGTKNPNNELTEINVRHSVFYPKSFEKNYITVDGLHLMHAATRWAPPSSEQVGVIGPNQASNWIIQNCIVEYGKTAGISIGRPYPDTPGYDITGWEKIGRHIIRNNIIRNCGQSGILGLYHCFGSIIENNLIEKIHLDRTFSGAEPAGIKFHWGVDVIIRNNIIRDVNAQGIWVDYANQGIRISGNVFQKIMWNQIHFEQNHGPILVDNNIFIGGPEGKGKWTFHATDAVVMAHNLFYNIDTTNYKSDKRNPSKYTPHTGNRTGNFSVGISNDLKSFNNIFINNTVRVHDEPGCKAGYNLYYNAIVMPIDSTGIAESFNPDFSYQLDDTGITIKMSASSAALKMSNPLITKSFIGDFPNTGQQLEDPNGNPMVVDKDIFGNIRNLSSPRVGPFEYLVPGNNLYRVGFTPFINDTTK